MGVYCVLEPDERRAEKIAFAELTARHLEDLRRGAAVWYVKGVVFNDDDYGSRQQRTFCSVYDRNPFDCQGDFVTPAKPGYNYGT